MLKKNFIFMIALLTTSQKAFSYIDLTKPVMSLEYFNQILEQHPEASELSDIPALLPGEYRINFILKHGILREGERGHLVERIISQSSSPTLPRAILWDERSGMVMSYNGGGVDQKANQRIDFLTFDNEKKTYQLFAADFPISHGKVQYTAQDCMSCHGQDQRPIFSMYPDWPSFYGSDNDEISNTENEVQVLEKKDYSFFLENIVPNNERYTSLYDAENIEKLLGISIYDNFPFRQNLDGNTDGNLNAISRSFAFRPSLRLGVLLNRIHSQHITKKIVEHKNFNEYGPYFLHELLECRWPATTTLSKLGKLGKFKNLNTKVESLLGTKRKTVAGTLHYRQLLSLVGLKVNDIDIRYSYNHEGYKNDDANKKVMEIGYIDSYWNSYFDGSATIDELVALKLYQHLIDSGMTSLKGIITPVSLESKYKHRAARYAFDKNFFQEMDRKGQWLPIPYPAKLTDVHHREGYPDKYVKQHKNLCSKLEEIILK
jgi:hypothetical protein